MGEVKDICKKFGKVERADVAQEPKGFAIVVFSNSRGAQKCIDELDGATFEDRELEVKLDEKQSSGGRARNGGGGKKFAGRLTSKGGGARGGKKFGDKVFIGNLPWSVEWQDLKDLCNQYGSVAYADVPQNDEGKSKGFGLVRFDSPGDCKNCINSLNGMLLDGRELEVRMDRG